MTQESPTRNPEADPLSVATQQVSLAEKWAALYADPSQEKGPASAEIILRNPSVYLSSINPGDLPESLQDQWAKLLSFSDEAAAFVAAEPVEWGAGTTGLEKIHGLVRDGNVNPLARGAVGAVMRISSALFSESTQHLPGNTQYYAGNVEGAAGWLDRAQAERAADS